ncbi:MAG: L-aspartate oxidase [Alphaproteobacteria bacterium]|nr:L-aspartate oxidase [Alphaproteobacteria bacterium]MCB9696872.1 L-aspartate oxidase [Alphaproteobacteria bacterium]
MWFALRAAAHGRVTVVTKTTPQESNSAYAQGGIAAVWEDGDDFEHHIEDTLVAGAGLCRRDAVEVTVREGPARVRELIEFGARFTRKDEDPAAYDLHREGGHSHRRILHAADFTGKEMVRALHEAAAEHPNITLLDHHMAVDLVTEGWLARRHGALGPADDRVLGAYVLDERQGTVDVHPAKVVVLATGGAGKVYKYTTNPEIATGDGMAMAWRAGARMGNMEFVQFHPTALFHHKEHHFLVSEALRGEGGKLLLPDGSRFMPRYDDRAELAPRDIVARAIDAELKRRGLDSVFLDMTHLPKAELEHKFPTIFHKLASLGIDMATEPIPVVPAAHYMCGGVICDLHGESSIRNLFAVGEVSCTGLHGANRLASNSLLEAIVFADRAAELARARLEGIPAPQELPGWDTGRAVDNDEQVVISQVWKEIRSFMWSYVGIVRTVRRLERARRRIALLKDEVEDAYWDFRLTAPLVELRNLLNVADMIVKCALKRRESRGLHYVTDFPEPDPRFLTDTVIQRYL